jgi:ubiquinone biosynthesis protein UbiJ
MKLRIVIPMLLLAAAAPAFAQDIRGVENCAAEKNMERRTGCLQANVDFLQQALTKLTRETQQQLTAATREILATKAETVLLKAEVAVLKAAVENLEKRIGEMRKDKK